MSVSVGTADWQEQNYSTIVPVDEVTTTAGLVITTLNVQPYFRSIILALQGGGGPVTTGWSLQGDTTDVIIGQGTLGGADVVTVPFYTAPYDTTLTLQTTGGGGRILYVSADQAYSVQQVTIVPPASSNYPDGSVVLSRSDGLFYPISSKTAGGTFLASGTLIAAPGAGNYVLLSSLFVYPGETSVGAIQTAVTATRNGSVWDLAAVVIPTVNQGGVPVAIPLPLGGILCDVNTAVNVAITGGGTISVDPIVIAHYDVVT